MQTELKLLSSDDKPRALDVALREDALGWVRDSHALILAAWSEMQGNEALNTQARELSDARKPLLATLNNRFAGSEDRALAQQSLKLMSPILRLVRIMADHKAKNHSAHAVSALLKLVAGHVFGARFSFENEIWIVDLSCGNRGGWANSEARQWAAAHPQWFAPLPARFAHDARSLSRLVSDARASMLHARKRRLRQRIEAEMSLCSDELALLKRYLQ